jgi:hypothetical protein
MMILQNKDGKNKVFIDNSITNNENIRVSDNEIIIINNGKFTNIYFSDELIHLSYISKIEFDINNNLLNIRDSFGMYMATKEISDDKIVSISLHSESMNNMVIQINTIEKDCNTCDNYTEPDEVDNGCYMCCKGLEYNYYPKENK